MSYTFYNFDGEVYADTPEGHQGLLEAIDDAIRAEAVTDTTNKTHEAEEEAVSMSYDGTHYQMPIWSNLMAIMQQCPYEINVRKLEVTVEPSGGEDLTENEMFQIAELTEGN